MKREDIDGVPVVWQDVPGPLTATLVFGVGRRDETFLHGGVTHLVEHLVMGSLGRTHLDCNASVDLGYTEFTATGRPEAVGEFLTRVCAALRDLPTDRLAVEAGVLAAEGGAACHPLAGYLLSRRFGAAGVGLGGLRDPAVDQIPLDVVRAWAADRFVRENAVLWLTGPVPDGVDLRLPSGPPSQPLTPVKRRIPLPYPVVVEHPFEDGVGVAFEVSRQEVRAELRRAGVADADDWDDDRVGVAIGALARILEHQITDALRHTRGMSYDVGDDVCRVDEDVVHLSLVADPRPRDAEQAAKTIIDVLRETALEGPVAAEVEFDLEGMTEYIADPRSALGFLGDAARSLLHHEPIVGPDELLAMRGSIDATVLAAVARVGLPTLIVGVPEGVRVQGAGLNGEPDDWQPPVTGRTFGRRFRSDAPRGSSLVVGDDGITLYLPDGRLTVRWDDVIGVGRDPQGFHRLIGFDSRSIPLDPRDWKDGEQVMATVRARVPAALWFDERDDGLPPDGHADH